MLDELWKPIRGYEGVYEVSDQGRIRRLAKRVPFGPGGAYMRTLPPCMLRPQMTRNGYLKVSLYGDAGSENRLVHRLVAEHHLPATGGGKRQVNHLDLCKTNNRVTNLEWATGPENMRHAQLGGRFDPVRNPKQRMKLEPADIAKIRECAEGGERQRDIGLHFGIQQSTVSKILRGQRWASHS